MEGYNSLSELKHNPLIEVSSVFENITIRYDLLHCYLSRLHSARSVADLLRKTRIASHKLTALEEFDSCSIEIHPGKSTDTAEVRFLFQDTSPLSV